MITNLAVRFLQKVDQSGDCWEWLASGSFNRWGRFTPMVSLDGKATQAQRAAYRIFIGAIPKDYELHHLCENRNHRCVNPWHLRAVTRAEHMKLDGRDRFLANFNRARTARRV